MSQEEDCGLVFSRIYSSSSSSSSQVQDLRVGVRERAALPPAHEGHSQAWGDALRLPGTAFVPFCSQAKYKKPTRGPCRTPAAHSELSVLGTLRRQGRKSRHRFCFQDFQGRRKQRCHARAEGVSAC